MHWIDTVIVLGMLAFFVGMALFTKRFSRSVADFLAANRCAGRYLLCIADGMAGLGAISVVSFFEMFYRSGFTGIWWIQMNIPVVLLIAISGWIIYRFRETRSLTMAQFFEKRYSKNLRVAAGIIAWLSGIINFGIFPAVGARFFIYFCGLPDTVLGMSTFALLMLALLALALFFVFLGGQIAVIITDFMQGIFSNIAFLAIIVFLFLKIDWSMLIETLQTAAPADASLVHPFHTAKVDSFNPVYFIITALIGIYGFKAWLGSSGYNASAKSAHEAKMAGIIGAWRGAVQYFFLLMLPMFAFVIMNNPDFASQAAVIGEAIANAGAENPQIGKQMSVPIILAHTLPIGLVGALCAVMLCAFISTHDTYLHSWGSIFIQDVILPLRKKPFTPKQHIWALRASIVFVAVFIFFFSLIFRQTQYIYMFFALTGAIWLGGAGSLIIGGLYTRSGTTRGAWAGLITGSVVAVSGVIMEQTWAGQLYPWLSANAPGVLAGFTSVLEACSAKVPVLNWHVTPEKFPFHGAWVGFFSAVLAIINYTLLSWIDHAILKLPHYNLDRLLHRGEYAIAGEHGDGATKPVKGWRTMMPTPEFSKGDRIIYWFNISWSIVWLSIFLIGTVYNLVVDVPVATWATFWKYYSGMSLLLATGTIIWFAAGGILDMKYLFGTLRVLKRNDNDDGVVVGEQDLADIETQESN